jgi:hypothetical protein
VENNYRIDGINVGGKEVRNGIGEVIAEGMRGECIRKPAHHKIIPWAERVRGTADDGK